jgi:hypothetical protein
MCAEDPLGLQRLNSEFAAHCDDVAWQTLLQEAPPSYVPTSVAQPCRSSKCGCGRTLVASECLNCGYRR